MRRSRCSTGRCNLVDPSMNLDIDREGTVRFVQVHADGSGLGNMLDTV